MKLLLLFAVGASGLHSVTFSRPQAPLRTAPRASLATIVAPLGATLARASLTKTVAPALGAGLANSMFFSGLPEVLEKKREGSLGEFNPIPMPIILGNTVGWVGYSLLTRDPFVAAANAPGLLLASWYVMTTYRLAEPSTAEKIQKVAMLMAAIHTATALACAFVLPSRAAMISLYGIVCNLILLAYYGAPLSTIGTVLKERSAKSIYLPMVLLNGLNALFWSAYALAIQDRYLLLPNAIGLSLAGVQALLCLFMSKKLRTENPAMA